LHGKIQTHPELVDVVNHSLYDKTNTIFNIRIDNHSWDYKWYYVFSY